MKEIILISLQILFFVTGAALFYAGFSVKYPPFRLEVKNPLSTTLLIVIIVLIMIFGIVNQLEGMKSQKSKHKTESLF